MDEVRLAKNDLLISLIQDRQLGRNMRCRHEFPLDGSILSLFSLEVLQFLPDVLLLCLGHRPLLLQLSRSRSIIHHYRLELLLLGNKHLWLDAVRVLQL